MAREETTSHYRNRLIAEMLRDAKEKPEEIQVSSETYEVLSQYPNLDKFAGPLFINDFGVTLEGYNGKLVHAREVPVGQVALKYKDKTLFMKVD